VRGFSRLSGLTLISAIFLSLLGCGGGGAGYGGGATGGGNSGGASAPIITQITITDPEPHGIIIGETQQFTVVAKDSSGNVVTNPTLVWKSSNPKAASVSATGLVTGLSTGASTTGTNLTTITASATYDSAGVYTTGPGTTYTSNKIVVEVSASIFAAGVVATGHAVSAALVMLEDAQGKTEVTLSDDDGRFMLSTSGLKAPFLLKADDGRGHVLFGVAATAGGTNIDTVTDFMLRAWYGARGTTPEAAFTDMAGYPAPDAKSLQALEHSFKGVLRDALTAEGLDADAFDLFSTPFVADSTGFDAVLDNTRALTGSHLQLQDGLMERTTEVGFSKGELDFTIR
jgi:hypothetical protein